MEGVRAGASVHESPRNVEVFDKFWRKPRMDTN